MKYQILKSQYLQINGTNRLPLKVYKIIALKTFEVTIKGSKANGYKDKTIIIKEGDIGGYIKDESNLPQDDNSWVFNTACVFENARLLDSVVMEMAKVCDSAAVINSTITGRARIFGASTLYNVFAGDNVDICEKSNAKDSYFYGSSRVNGQSSVIQSSLSIGARVNKQATVIRCELTDQVEVTGGAICEGCNYSGQTFIKGGKHINENLKEEIQLDIVSVADPSRILDF